MASSTSLLAFPSSLMKSRLLCIEPLESRIAPAFAAVFELSSLNGLNGFKMNGAAAYDDSGRVSDVLQPMTGSCAGFGRVRGPSKQMTETQETPNIIKTNYLSAPVTAPNPSLVPIAACDSRSPAISQKETKRTKVRRVGFALILAAFVGSCVTAELRAQVIVVPNSLATNDGNTALTAPTGGPSSLREMRIYDAAQFGDLSGPSFLTQFAWRPDTTPGPSGPRTLTLRIYASTTSRSVAGLSTTFAENLGTNNTLVFDGTVNVATGNLPGPGNTRQFDYVFPFTTPFLYDPAAGNLVLDLQIVGSGSALTFDTVLSGDPAIGRVFANSSSTATTGTIWADTHVTQFTFVPEPTVGVSVLFGLGLLIAKRKRPSFSPNALQK